jgi:plastocyanin domain-containing protein
MSAKSTIISILIASVLIGGAIIFSKNKPDLSSNNINPPSVIDGEQTIEIFAKGGYNPRITDAKAGIPTLLKIKTSGTFDCSSAIAIPSINYRANLQPTGEADIEIPPQESGAVLRGVCAMGMYNFEIRFE